MITIAPEEFRSRIASVFPRAQFPKVQRALTVAIVHRKFFEQVWRSWWAHYKRSRNLTYFNAGMCNLITSAAAVEFDWMVNKEAAKTGLDVAGGLVAANIFLSAGSNLNHVSPPDGGGHCTAIVGLTTDDKTWSPFFYEPQERIEDPLSLTSLDAAAADFVRVFDVFD